MLDLTLLDLTLLLRAYAKFRLRKLRTYNVVEAQENQLLRLVNRAADTKFGKQHGFQSIRSVKDFQSQVPVRSYESLWSDYWKPEFPRLTDCTWPGVIPFFAVSSGTSSGTTKYIPYTHEMTASNARGGLDLLVHHVSNRPRSRIFGGRSFMLGGSTDLVEQTPGIYSGDLSGIAAKTLPWWARQRFFPPPELALLKNWEEKIDRLARESLLTNIHMISGVPSWLLIFFDKLSQLVPHSDGRLHTMYPDLELLVHGGVNFAPYHHRFCELLEGGHAELREVYPASEGFIGVADRGYGEGLRLIADHGIFFEFIPFEELESADPTRHWVRDIELEVNYAIVLTTCAGVWAYLLGDTVKFVDRDPPRLLVTGRTSYYLSAFGEHVIADELEDAVSTAAKGLALDVVDYSVGPIYPEKPGELGGHLYVLELSRAALTPAEVDQFSKRIDKRLCERNEDYEAHRAQGYGLRPPQVQIAKPGAFAAWMKSRGKLGGQNKVPRIITSRELFSELLTFTERFEREST